VKKVIGPRDVRLYVRKFTCKEYFSTQTEGSFFVFRKKNQAKVEQLNEQALQKDVNEV
jgi:hypothetical protein